MSNLADTRRAPRAGAGLSGGELRKLLISAAIFVLAALVPFVVGGYPLQLAINIAMYAALATSWRRSPTTAPKTMSPRASS